MQGQGILSKKIINVDLKPNTTLGLRFILPGDSIFPANITSLFSSQRNTVLGNSDLSLCFVEHFLAACALNFVDNLDIFVDGEEMPFGDGSASIWLDSLSPYYHSAQEKTIVIDEIIHIANKDSYIKLVPSDKFSLTYHLDLSHTQIEPITFSWARGDSINDLLRARTFAPFEENRLLACEDILLSYDQKSFSKKLLNSLEPACHKALDLIGDLMLASFNPLYLKAHIMSYKGGHALNAQLAEKLYQIYHS